MVLNSSGKVFHGCCNFDFSEVIVGLIFESLKVYNEVDVRNYC